FCRALLPSDQPLLCLRRAHARVQGDPDETGLCGLPRPAGTVAPDGAGLRADADLEGKGRDVAGDPGVLGPDPTRSSAASTRTGGTGPHARELGPSGAGGAGLAGHGDPGP